MTVNLTLIRETNYNGTFGSMVLPDVGKTEVATVEPIWGNNEPFFSCIPVGFYFCQKAYYNAGEYDTYEVMNVPDRDDILFHIGNFVHNTEGCVLINTRIGSTKKGLRGYESKVAFNRFMEVMKSYNNFTLSIVNKTYGVVT